MPPRKLSPTGHKAFDKEAANDYIGTGNVYSNVQFSSYIRGFNNTECNGRSWNPGELQKADLDPWTAFRYHNARLPKHISDVVKNEAKDCDVILYMFYHGKFSRNTGVVHGFALTTADHKLLHSWVTGKNYKSADVMAEAILHIVG